MRPGFPEGLGRQAALSEGGDGGGDPLGRGDLRRQGPPHDVRRGERLVCAKACGEVLASGTTW